MNQDETRKETEPVLDETSGSSKRRGRKPKPETEEASKTTEKRETSTKSKYKKPTSIVSVGAFEDSSASSSSVAKRPLLFFKVENTILHFPIRTDMGPTLAEKTPHLFEDRLSENSPLPFDPNTTLNYTLEQQSDPCSNYSFFQPNQFQSSQSQTDRDYRIIPVLPSFTEEAKNGRLPDRTDIACYWCTERFDSCPIGLPEKKVGSSFYVSRCFCDFNCCAAYNFRMDDDRMWERYSLLNLMYQKVFNTNQIIRVQQAPPRESLIKFGGRMTIEEFRNYSKQNNKKCLKMVEFPVITLQNFIEEVGENQSFGSVSDTGSVQQAIDIKMQIDKANEQYKLSRKKTNTNKNSLEVCMGLKNF